MHLRQGVGLAWIRDDLFYRLKAEADRAYPLETGGVMMGYWGPGSTNAVITEVIGSGPNALHERHSFVPDYEYQEQRIAEHYTASDRRHAYLGDWHTHPGSRARLSWRDRRTLLRIALWAEARNPRPLMAVLAGTPGQWNCTIWKATPRRWARSLLGPRLTALSIQTWS